MITTAAHRFAPSGDASPRGTAQRCAPLLNSSRLNETVRSPSPSGDGFRAIFRRISTRRIASQRHSPLLASTQRIVQSSFPAPRLTAALRLASQCFAPQRSAPQRNLRGLM